ncbi:MAG: DUF1499 domain-containing protein [Nitrospira sp.]|nr:DUF1499 domain-containing protein [Nitrospira sp.]MEB2337958.1 DUF1499 domain-containing protein [Nitrospirales bacterium]
MRQLPPCPSSPNCVSTQAQDSRHGMAPWPYRVELALAKAEVKRAMLSLPRTVLVDEDDHYQHYECTSFLLRFADDVEFLFDDDHKLIQFRSASRVGYGDLGVNRRRMEQVRGLLEGHL